MAISLPLALLGVSGGSWPLISRCAAEETRNAPPVSSTAVNGLVGYWPFDEGQGDSAANVMGLNGDLFVHGKVGSAAMPSAAWAEGKFGQAARFERNGPGLPVGHVDELDCDTAVSVAAWVNLPTAESRPDAMIWECGNAYRLALDKEGKNRVRFQLNLDGKYGGNWLLSKTALDHSRWYHIAGVYDGKERRIYLDGQPDAKEPMTGTISRGGRLTIGQGFTGLIDELKVWNRALSESEVKQAMREDQGRVKALFQPEHALQFYPVKCVAMLGQPAPIEIAVFNSARAAFHGDATWSVVSPSGAKLAEETLALSIPARERMLTKLTFQPKDAGRHTLIVRVREHQLFQTALYALAPQARSAAGELKLNPVVSVDLAQELGPDIFCDDGESRIVDSPLGRYRESGPAKMSRFVVRATLRRPGLHLLRVRYPDDKARTCEITACSPVANDVYSAQTGYLTGVPYPLSMQFQTMDCLLWARSAEQWIRFCGWGQGGPAAAASVEVFEIEGRLPASPASVEPAHRHLGQYWEDAFPLTHGFGGGDSRSFEAFDRAVCNLCDYMDYTGQNVLHHPAVWYNGPIYNSLVEPRGRGQGAGGGSAFPRTGWIDILLKRFEERGFQFFPTLNVHDLPSLRAAANTDLEKIKAGEPTFNSMTKDNQVLRETWHHQPPAFNALHPRVQRQVLALVDELSTRYGQSPAFGGIAFHLTKCQLLQLGGLDVGYDDWTVWEFAKDTGVSLPIDAKDPERFSKRNAWLMANAKDRWTEWRCQRMADYYGEAARLLKSKNPDHQLVLAIWTPAVIMTDIRKRWEQGERLAHLTRETGVDPSLLAQHPGVIIQKFMSATDYRWRLALAGWEAEQTLLPIRRADFAEDQLNDYRTTERCGVHFHNRYFENGSMRKLIDGKPMTSAWYREPSWLASGITPSHDHFMEYYAHAMSVLDPALITIGGFTVGTVGHETQVEQFARVFRRLPPGDWKTIPELGNQVVGRSLQVGGKYYLYVVNRGASETHVAFRASVAPHPMQPLGPSPVLQRKGDGYVTTLSPYQLSAWISE